MEDVVPCEVVHIISNDFCRHYTWTDVFAANESYKSQLPKVPVWRCGKNFATYIVCVRVCLYLMCLNLCVSVGTVKFPVSMHDDTSLLAAEM